MRKITKGLRLPKGAGSSLLRVEVDLENRIFYFYISGELIQEERFFESVPLITAEERIEDAEKSKEGLRLGLNSEKERANLWQTRANKRETFIEKKGLSDEYDEWFWGDFEIEEQKEGANIRFKGLKPL